MAEEVGLKDLISAIVQIADSLDRLTFLVEEISARGLDLPTRDDLADDGGG